MIAFVYFTIAYLYKSTWILEIEEPKNANQTEPDRTQSGLGQASVHFVGSLLVVWSVSLYVNIFNF